MRFGFIGDAFEWVLRQIVEFIPSHNYAIAVLLFIVLIRLVLMPLDIKSKRGMMKMSKVNPQLEALRAKYKDDPQKLNKKMSELYKKEGVSPMSGCLPMLISLPLLFAMFAVIRDLANEGTVLLLLDVKEHLEAGELDYRPALQSFLWIKNIFQPDSFFSTVMPEAATDVSRALMGMPDSTAVYTAEMLQTAREFLCSQAYATWAEGYGNAIWYRGSVLALWTVSIPYAFNGWCILPPLAGLSQFLSSKLMNAGAPQQAPSQQKKSGDPSAATGKMMKYFFPIFSVLICFTSNAVFALYWVVSAAVQSVQTYLIGKWIDKKEAEKAAKEALEA